MDYSRIYHRIIVKAQSEKRTKTSSSYYERHHIIPRCLGGANDNDNLVLLTAREHFLAHKILTFIYPNNKGLACAFHMMANTINKKTRVTSRDYAYSREIYVKNITGVKMSPETREKMRMAKLGKSPLRKIKAKWPKTDKPGTRGKSRSPLFHYPSKWRPTKNPEG